MLDPTPEIERKPDSESRIIANLETLFWIGLAASVIYYTDFFRVVFTDPAVNIYWFRGGLLLIGINATIGIYLVFGVGYWKQVHVSEWEKHVPWAIPVASGAAILSAISLTVGLWPVWGLLTPVLVFVILVSAVFFLSALPFKAPRSRDSKELKVE